MTEVEKEARRWRVLRACMFEHHDLFNRIKDDDVPEGADDPKTGAEMDATMDLIADRAEELLGRPL